MEDRMNLDELNDIFWRGHKKRNGSWHPYGCPEHQDSSQEPFQSSKDLMPEMEDRWNLDGLNGIFWRRHQKRRCSWHPLHRQGRFELKTPLRNNFCSQMFQWLWWPKGRLWWAGRVQPPRRPCLKLKTKEVGRNPNSCPQGLGKSGRQAAFFLVLI